MSEATTEAFIRLNEKGYIRYEEGRWLFKLDDLAKLAIAALDNGTLTIEPAEQAKIYRHFLENIHDWEISRQNWWGHQIPAWQIDGTDQWIIAHNEAEAYHIAHRYPQWINATLTRSEDRLDTWFTSALWPFAILGWPNKTADYETYFPAALLETGSDILFFWGARMIMMSLALTGQLPFKTIYLHGLIRDKQNRKMSKSLGNGIEPMGIAAEYGTDALRFALAAHATAGQDTKWSKDKIEAAKRFTNKIWNASRFILKRTTKADDIRDEDEFRPTEFDREFLIALADFEGRYRQLLSDRQFQQAAKEIYQFFWETFANGYLENAKSRINSGREASTARFILRDSLRRLLKLLHPITPFITEEIWGKFNFSLLINQKYF